MASCDFSRAKLGDTAAVAAYLAGRHDSGQPRLLIGQRRTLARTVSILADIATAQASLEAVERASDRSIIFDVERSRIDKLG
jgi:hypothetical protein